MVNEFDIVYFYLFNYIKGDEWKSQEMVKKLVKEYFQDKLKGLSGNDDIGIMFVWLVYLMMGIYLIFSGDLIYMIIILMFDKIMI